MASKHGVHRTPFLGWHPRSAALLAWLEEEIKRRRDEGSRAPQGDLLEEAVDSYRLSREQQPCPQPVPDQPGDEKGTSDERE